MAQEPPLADSLIPVIRPDWQAPPCVRVLNSTRLGGISKEPFDSLNLGLHVQDDEQAVRENRRRLLASELIPSEPHWLHQVHGNSVLEVSNREMTSQPVAQADASFTATTGTVLAIVTADCLPVVITNESGTRLAAAHAGWKGLACGVLEASLTHFDNDEAIHVWFGPAIGPKHFEVGEEVVDAFVSVDTKQAEYFTPHVTVANKYFANIFLLAQRIVNRYRVNASRPVHFSGGDHCTYSDKERFHSYRRDGAASGRMALLAWIDDSIDSN